MTRVEFLRRSDAEYVASLLVKHNGNITHAAREAGINRVSLHKIIQRHGLARREPNRGNDAWQALQ